MSSFKAAEGQFYIFLLLHGFLSKLSHGFVKIEWNSTYRNLNLWTILVLLNVQFQGCQGRQSYVQKRILIMFRYSFRNKYIPGFPTSKLNLTTTSSMTTINQDCPKLNQCCANLSQVNLSQLAVPSCRVDRLIRNCAGRCHPPTWLDDDQLTMMMVMIWGYSFCS